MRSLSTSPVLIMLLKGVSPSESFAPSWLSRHLFLRCEKIVFQTVIESWLLHTACRNVHRNLLWSRCLKNLCIHFSGVVGNFWGLLLIHFVQQVGGYTEETNSENWFTYIWEQSFSNILSSVLVSLWHVGAGACQV